jgi:hypothetical protein
MKKERNIFKEKKHINNFSITDNKIHQSELSIHSIGVLLHLLSKPEDWVITKSYFINFRKMSRWDIDNCFKELEILGFMTRELVQKTKINKSGVSYKVYEKSIIVDLTK